MSTTLDYGQCPTLSIPQLGDPQILHQTMTRLQINLQANSRSPLKRTGKGIESTFSGLKL